MDKNEFAARVVAQTDRMYRIAYVLLRDPEDCRDAMQEAALRAWEKRRSLARGFLRNNLSSNEQTSIQFWDARLLMRPNNAMHRNGAYNCAPQTDTVDSKNFS